MIFICDADESCRVPVCSECNSCDSAEACGSRSSASSDAVESAGSPARVTALAGNSFINISVAKTTAIILPQMLFLMPDSPFSPRSFATASINIIIHYGRENASVLREFSTAAAGQFTHATPGKSAQKIAFCFFAT